VKTVVVTAFKADANQKSAIYKIVQKEIEKHAVQYDLPEFIAILITGKIQKEILGIAKKAFPIKLVEVRKIEVLAAKKEKKREERERKQAAVKAQPVEDIFKFQVHYSGLDEEGLDPFISFAGCLNSQLEIEITMNQCDVGSVVTDHPKWRIMGNGGYPNANYNINLYWTWDGSEISVGEALWTTLIYRYTDKLGNCSTGTNALLDFAIQFRVTAAGLLQFRVNNARTGAGNMVHAVILGRIRAVHFDAPLTNYLEIGNDPCHEEVAMPPMPDAEWLDGIWGTP
jgi:hypothetical protein